MSNLDALTHNAGKDLPLTRRCRVCEEEEWQWHGYVRDKDGRYMSFCDKCKNKWVSFAQQYGVKFGYNNAYPQNASLEQIEILWNIFIKKKVWKKELGFFSLEKVDFT
jgi:hypothetical protein